MRIPSTHEGLWQMFLSRTGIFWGATWDVTVSWTDSRRHCESARGSVRTCSILDLLSEEFLISHCAHLCLGETESARWDISPSMLFILRVPRSPCHSVSHPGYFFVLIFGLPQADGLDSGESSAKPPHLDNIPVTVGTLTGANRLCDDSRSCRLTIKQRRAVVLQLF